MTLVRKILSIAGAVLIGSGVGLAAFYGYTLFDALGFYWSSSGRATAIDVYQSSNHVAELAQEDGFFYKPLSSQVREISKEGKTILADLNAMALTLYQDGKEVRVFPIVSKGRPGSFWETPTGEYRVLSREERHFSSIGEVWMPYSVGFFGNFFIHGWPTYPSGEPVPEGFSGGCIRLKTDDAKTVYDFVEKNTPIVVTEDASPSMGERGYVTLKHTRPPRLSAESYVVGDLGNNFVFLERGRDEIRPIASITKLMTATISLEAVNQAKNIMIREEDLDVYGDTGGLVHGEVYAAKDLLPPLLLSSSNDAAYALARSIGTERFVNLMNNKAMALALSHTHFSDPSGLEMKNESTAEELLYLMKYVRDVHAPLLEITKKNKVSFTTNKTSHTWYNFNWKSDDPLFVGGKIGYSEAAQQTIVALFRIPVSEFSTRDIGIAVLGSDDAEADARKLAAWVGANFVYGSIPEERVTATALQEVKTDTREPDDQFSMLFVGDVMMDRGIRAVIENHADGDFVFPFKKLRDELAGADLTFGNLEGPISDKGEKHGSIYSFRMDPAVTKALYDVGFDVVSLANNHVGDYGRVALEDTMRRLDRAGIGHAGAGWNSADVNRPTIIERAGTRIGFLAFSDVGPEWMRAGEALSGIAIADADTVRGYVRQARDKVDILIVSFHFGEEYEARSRARQQSLARAAVDAGAKIVIGHHPHVAQEIEKYGGGVIAYSLGNFIFDQAFSEDTKKALMLKIDMKGATIENVEPIPIAFNEYFQPEIKK